MSYSRFEQLINQAIDVFIANPITGIGAGQFQNYNAPGVVEKWRVTHDVWLQVASELGMFGLGTFAFLVVRAYSSCFATLRMLRPRRRRRLADPVAQSARAFGLQSLVHPVAGNGPPQDRRPPGEDEHDGSFTDEERRILEISCARPMLVQRCSQRSASVPNSKRFAPLSPKMSRRFD